VTKIPTVRVTMAGSVAVGRGLGVVDEFSPDGRLISRITSG
jgi:hypothetical protein